METQSQQNNESHTKPHSTQNEGVSVSQEKEESKVAKDAESFEPMASDNVEVLDKDEEESSSSQEIKKLTHEVESLNNKNLRLLAEMDNLKRRQAKESLELKKFANEKILEDFLPVLDSLDKALLENNMTEDQGSSKESFLDGFKMVQNQALMVLKKFGLEKIEAKDASFDPNLHQAIKRDESSEVDSDTVGEVYAEGYTLSGRLLRPAMVSVVVAKASKKPEGDT